MDIYILKKKKESIAIADFRTLSYVDFDKVPNSKYILSSLITPEEERCISYSFLLGLDKWIGYQIQDRHYPKRFIVSSIVFLFLYLFCSLTVHDPIPIIDEIAIGLVGAFITWHILSSHDIEAKDTKEKKNLLHESVMKAEFSYSSFMSDIEEYYQKIEEIGFKELLSMIADNTLPEYGFEYQLGFGQALDSYLGFSKKLEKRYVEEIKKNRISGKRLKKHLLADYVTGNLDLYFLAFYIGYSKNK